MVFQIWYLMETNVQTLCTMRIIGSYTFQPLWVSGINNICIIVTSRVRSLDLLPSLQAIGRILHASIRFARSLLIASSLTPSLLPRGLFYRAFSPFSSPPSPPRSPYFSFYAHFRLCIVSIRPSSPDKRCDCLYAIMFEI